MHGPRYHTTKLPCNGQYRGDKPRQLHQRYCHRRLPTTTGMPLPQKNKTTATPHFTTCPSHRSQQGETTTIPPGLLRLQHLQRLRTSGPTTHGRPTNETDDRPTSNPLRLPHTHPSTPPLARRGQSRPGQRRATGSTRTRPNWRTSHMVSSDGHMSQEERHTKKDN